MGAQLPRWTAREIAYLERAWGQTECGRIARRLGRSPLAVRMKAQRLGLSLKGEFYTGRQVAGEFGVASHTVSGWIATGLLVPSGRRAQCWLIAYEELERFIRERIERPNRWTQWDWRRMPRGYFRSYAASIAEQLASPRAAARPGECGEGGAE